jgi:beta-carotene hydroxylase
MVSVTPTIKQEMLIGRQYSPDIAWPTIMLAIGICISLAVSTWAALTDLLPYWACGVINSVILYGSYTVIHEAVHYNIVPRKASVRWMNSFFGLMICAVLWMFFYPHKKSHMVHHAKCNTEDDPDIYARGTFGVVTFWRIPVAVLGSFNPFGIYNECLKFRVTDSDRWITMTTFAAYTIIVISIVFAGYGYELLVLWFIPFFIGYSIMLIFFTWIPHHPHTESTRYRDTRCSVWPGANFFTQGQHMHLIHHMMPWVPYYQYEKVFHEIRPYLEQNNSMIDGFWPASPKVSPKISP